MIRRDTTLPDGSPGWILISQIEHARISAELAAAWGGPQVAPLPFFDALVRTIRHHDDGWRLWETRPEIEPSRQRPYNFLEMPETTAHGIWSASIDQAAEFGPLAQATIAGHFVELRKKHPGHDSAAAQSFLSRYEPLIRAWRARLSSDEEADLALAALQFFDAWSLWLCCSESPPATRLAPGNPFSVELKPLGGGTIAVRPWPFSSDTLSLSALGRVVPAREYRSAEELASVPQEPAHLHWNLQPQR